MSTVPTSPSQLGSRLDKLGERMHMLDQELFAAERDGSRGRRIACLMERAQLWRSYAEVLTDAGQEAYTAQFAARTDHRAALALQAEAEAL